MTKTLKLTKGFVTIVDDEDYKRYSRWKWSYSKGYAVRAFKDKGRYWTVYLHREIAKTPKNLFTDHINHNKLDNRRSNLRHATTSQNCINRPKDKRGSSKYKGVTLFRRTGRWKASFKYFGQHIHLGYFEDESEASYVYNQAVSQVYGEFAVLNSS